ncbi:hypothetical protein ACFY1S_04635 [Micromonospora sp. NPDC000663]|uniref:hypothetical protein n=1 Tax=Micromonospora sp. NPDC000663 TaxID=3364218 RepID=UPI003684A958
MGFLSSAAEVGRYASAARAGAVLLTHLWPGTDPEVAIAATWQAYAGPVTVARPGVVVDLPG